MLSSNCAEPVYQFIWEYITTNEMLPSRQQIADGLALDKEQVSACVYGLRQQGRLSTCQDRRRNPQKEVLVQFR